MLTLIFVARNGAQIIGNMKAGNGFAAQRKDVIDVIFDPGFRCETRRFAINFRDALPIDFCEPLGNAVDEISSALVGIGNDLVRITCRPLPMRLAMVFASMAVAVSDPAFGAKTSAALDFATDGMIAEPIGCLSAIAKEPPAGFAAAANSDMLLRNQSSETLSRDVLLFGLPIKLALL